MQKLCSHKVSNIIAPWGNMVAPQRSTIRGSTFSGGPQGATMFFLKNNHVLARSNFLEGAT
jgi:hypothetical protein